MNTKNYYTALILNKNIVEFELNKDCYKILNTKECSYEKGYSIVEYEVIGKSPYDDDIDTMLDALGALVIHESGSNAFCLYEDDVEEVSRIYTWAKSATFMMADLLTSEDIRKILYKKFDIHDNNDELYINDSNMITQRKWIKVTKDTNLFNIDIDKVKVGENGREESVWIQYLLGEYTDCYIVIKIDDYKDEDITKQINFFDDPAAVNDFPWFDDKYYDYEYGYNNKK